MNFAFWVIACNLIIVALLLVVIPIWFGRRVKIDDNQQHNLEIGRQKLAELKAQRDHQLVSQAEYEEQLLELELALNDELKSTQNLGVQASQGRWVLALIVPLLPITAITIYSLIGAPQMLNASSPVQASAENSPKTAADINTMLTKLVQRLKEQPGDIKGWLILGRTYMVMKDFPKAVDAYAKANTLQADNADILLQYADALAMSNGGRMSGKPSEMVFKALAIEPEHSTGLWLAGMAKTEQGDYTSALEYWLKLEPKVANDPETSATLQRIIAEARAKTGQQVAPVQKAQSQAAPQQTPESITGPVLTIHAELSSELQQKVSPTDTVFIYAQAQQGMRIPLAIVRKQVRDLPITATLSDAQAMSPMAKLSGFEHVKVLARISKAGSAMPQAGDLFGVVESVPVTKTETIQIVIAEVIE